MKNLLCCILFFLTASGLRVLAQSESITSAPADKRLRLLWQYCTNNFISDQDSVTVHLFLDEVIEKGSKLKDEQLKAYAQYFKKSWRILFSERYEVHFPGGPQSAVDLLASVQSWALKNKYLDIFGSCDHYIGQIYYRANRYGLAFEHLLDADNTFRKIGYRHVPNISAYLYHLGLCFYRFEEYDKAVHKFLEATGYSFYLPRVELNTLNAIGLIYVRKNEPGKAIQFFRSTMAKARLYGDSTWIGIAAGNVGNILMERQQNDSALYYHHINYSINGKPSANAPEDAAKTALSMAALWVRKQAFDSALFYADRGRELAGRFIKDSTESLDFNKRLLMVRVDYRKATGDYRGALLLMDSLRLVEQELRSKLDNKILSRAIEKTEASSYANNLALLKSQKKLTQLRFYFIIAALVIVLLLAAGFFRDKWLREKRQMQLAEKDKQILLAEKQRAEDGLTHARELLNAYLDTIKEKTKLIGHLESELTDLKELPLQAPELETITLNREKLMRSTILTEEEWLQFRNLFEQVYPGFSYRLKGTYPELSPAETRFFYLAKLSLSSREMATMLGISVDAIHKLRYRLRKKLNLDDESGFEAVLRKIDEQAVLRPGT